MHQRRIAFIGAGNMAGALIRGLLRSSRCAAADIRACEPDDARREAVCSEFGIGVVRDSSELLDWAEVIVLAVKPQVLPGVLVGMEAERLAAKLWVSVAAGVPCDVIESLLPESTAVVRAMPNTPALVQAGATAIAKGTHATDEDLAWARELFLAVGRVVAVEERLLDVVTGLSGSGPAYVLLVIEALADGAVKMGLPKPQALELAASTVLGAAALLLETGEHPGKLKDQVTSPGGTTIAGLAALERAGVRAGLMDAVESATRRATELGALGQRPGGRDRS